ncbi:hypothetical protein [Flavobacterium tructae]|uniref:hypothetical protein n=1 Tax=Flavobacterium tructae TaxID=1114873 RepID=UPI0035A81A30
MKNLNYLNYFFVGLPLIFYSLSLIIEEFIFLGMLSTILTGIFQVTIGIQMIQDEPQDKNLKIYIGSVVLFFFSLFLFYKLELHDFFSFTLFGIPPFIAIYLSVIIFKKANK